MDASRARAIEVLHAQVLAAHGCEPNCAAVAMDALEAAGLLVVDAADRKRLDDLRTWGKAAGPGLPDWLRFVASEWPAPAGREALLGIAALLDEG